jgi:outer membrane protein assembly factor BamB
MKRKLSLHFLSGGLAAIVLLAAPPALRLHAWAEDATPIDSVPASPADWPLFRGNSLSTGVYPGTLPDQLDVLWTFEPEKAAFEATAVIAGGVVYVGSLDGELFAVNLADGSEKWKFPTEAGFRAAAAVRATPATSTASFTASTR